MSSENPLHATRRYLSNIISLYPTDSLPQLQLTSTTPSLGHAQYQTPPTDVSPMYFSHIGHSAFTSCWAGACCPGAGSEEAASGPCGRAGSGSAPPWSGWRTRRSSAAWHTASAARRLWTEGAPVLGEPTKPTQRRAPVLGVVADTTEGASVRGT